MDKEIKYLEKSIRKNLIPGKRTSKDFFQLETKHDIENSIK